MDKKFQVQKYANADEAVFACGQALNNTLIENSKFPILLLLSGGSALEILDEILPEALGEHLTISMLDERFSRDHKINNFSQMQATSFYELALANNVNFFGTLPRPEENIENFARRMELTLKTWANKNPSGKIFATLGMGPDGHTAGIFPFSDKTKFDDLFLSENWTIGYTAPHKYSERVTTTLTFFEKIHKGFALVCGAEKKSAFDRLITCVDKINFLPVLGWQKIKNIKIFTDII
jgi:6-phosphogluconolactonase/glucosamine-6-phosphate isomerase/deaminase